MSRSSGTGVKPVRWHGLRNLTGDLSTSHRSGHWYIIRTNENWYIQSPERLRQRFAFDDREAARLEAERQIRVIDERAASRRWHYLTVISSGPLMMVRVPYPMPRWRSVVQAMTPVMQSYGFKLKDLSSFSAVLPPPDSEWDDEAVHFAARLDAAFDGDRTCIPKFALYDWRNGAFTKVRDAEEEE